MGPDDGIVPVKSVEESGEFRSLSQTDNCHTNVFTDEEYDKVIGVFLDQRGRILISPFIMPFFFIYCNNSLWLSIL